MSEEEITIDPKASRALLEYGVDQEHGLLYRLPNGRLAWDFCRGGHAARERRFATTAEKALYEKIRRLEGAISDAIQRGVNQCYPGPVRTEVIEAREGCDLGTRINEWLDENGDITLYEIKFASGSSIDNGFRPPDGGLHRRRDYHGNHADRFPGRG